jgi:threonine synthase
MHAGGGKMISIDEASLVTAYHDLALKGFYVEPTSALVWAAILRETGLPKPTVAIITGSGYKSIII